MSDSFLAKQFVVLSLATSIYFVLGTMQGETSISDYWVIEEMRDRYAKRVTTLENDVQHLEREVERLTHSKKYARKVLRDKYNLLEPGEKVIFFAK